MSSMLWAAAAAVSTPLPVTAEELLERAQSYYAIEEDKAPECSESREGEIVVCRVVGDPDRFRVPSPTEEGKTDNGIPRAPNVSGLPDCATATFCSKVGGKPRHVILIDLSAIPEAPEGSDADRIAKGEMAAP